MDIENIDYFCFGLASYTLLSFTKSYLVLPSAGMLFAGTAYQVNKAVSPFFDQYLKEPVYSSKAEPDQNYYTDLSKYVLVYTGSKVIICAVALSISVAVAHILGFSFIGLLGQFALGIYLLSLRDNDDEESIADSFQEGNSHNSVESQDLLPECFYDLLSREFRQFSNQSTIPSLSQHVLTILFPNSVRRALEETASTQLTLTGPSRRDPSY
jgi:hypothetical protein